MRGLFAFAGIVLLGAAGCATSRDLRTLRMQVADMEAEQVELARKVRGLDSTALQQSSETRALVVDLKYSVSDVSLRLDRLEALVADLDSRLGRAPAAPAAPVVVPSTDGGPSAWGDTLPPGQDSAPAGAAEEQYRRAFEALRQEDYGTAITGFRAYLAREPAASEAGSAVYWIAEAFYARGETDSAITQFQAVIDRYPDSDKVPAALYKVGSIYEARGDKASAFPYYRRLKEEFPQSLEFQQLRRKLGE